MDDVSLALANRTRRQMLKGALGVAAVAALPEATDAKALHPHKVELYLEGDAEVSWIHSLYIPPILAGGLPPGTAGRVRAIYPTVDPPKRVNGFDVLDLTVYLTVAGLPPGVPGPELAVISSLRVLGEEMLASVATFGEESTRPANNFAMMGRCISNDPVSPFGLLDGRVAYLTFGFSWTSANSDAATFKLVMAAAAGSHITGVPVAAGTLSLA